MLPEARRCRAPTRWREAGRARPPRDRRTRRAIVAFTGLRLHRRRPEQRRHDVRRLRRLGPAQGPRPSSRRASIGRRRDARIQGGAGDRVFSPPPAIHGLGQTDGFEFELQDRGEGDTARLRGGAGICWCRRAGSAAGAVRARRSRDTPQLHVDIDREKAKTRSACRRRRLRRRSRPRRRALRQRLQQARPGRGVLMQADPSYRTQPEDLGGSTCARRSGEMMPLAAFATVQLHVRRRDARRASTACPRSKIQGDGRARRELGRGDRRDRERSRRESCRRSSASRGAALSYQEKRAGGPTVALSRSRCSWCSCSSPRCTRAGRCRSSVLLAMPFGAFGALRGRVAARPDQRRLLPDRARHADRPRRQERDPDRRVRVTKQHERASPSSRGDRRARGCASGRS